MDIQEDKDFAALPEVAKLYQACKERDLTIAEREYLKGARDAWQAKAQAVPEGFVVVPKEPTDEMWSSGIDAYTDAMEDNKALPAASINDIYKAMIEAQEPAND